MYSYVKGKGWVPVSESQTITMACGSVVRYECRTPLPGERFQYVDRKYSKWLNPDRTEPNEVWLRNIRSGTLDCEYLASTDSTFEPRYYFYLVLIPI